jgi:hypothetical protein
MATSTDLKQQLVDIDRRLRQLARLWQPVAHVGSDSDPRSTSHGASVPPTDQLLQRIERATAALDVSTVRDAADLFVMRALLADVSLVIAAFRHGATAGGRALDEARVQVESARPAVVAHGEGDRTATS